MKLSLLFAAWLISPAVALIIWPNPRANLTVASPRWNVTDFTAEVTPDGNAVYNFDITYQLDPERPELTINCNTTLISPAGALVDVDGANCARAGVKFVWQLNPNGTAFLEVNIDPYPIAAPSLPTQPFIHSVIEVPRTELNWIQETPDADDDQDYTHQVYSGPRDFGFSVGPFVTIGFQGFV